jgi:crotonobetainyl-CoA:carnitine CoA-transferase CaiB-like acyl-CoA transferase
VIAVLEANGVPCAPVREPAEAVRDELSIERADTVALRHPDYGGTDGLIGSGLPIHLSAARTGYAETAPRLGEHDDEVYRDLLGYPAERLDQLRAQGVIR